MQSATSDGDGCVDDADLLGVLFQFGQRGYTRYDLNWDGAIDDADLLHGVVCVWAGVLNRLEAHAVAVGRGVVCLRA
jgi:hypothetical protein